MALPPPRALRTRLPGREAGWEVGLPKDGGRIEKSEPLPRAPSRPRRVRASGSVGGGAPFQSGRGGSGGRPACSLGSDAVWRVRGEPRVSSGSTPESPPGRARRRPPRGPEPPSGRKCGRAEAVGGARGGGVSAVGRLPRSGSAGGARPGRRLRAGRRRGERGGGGPRASM